MSDPHVDRLRRDFEFYDAESRRFAAIRDAIGVALDTQGKAREPFERDALYPDVTPRHAELLRIVNAHPYMSNEGLAKKVREADPSSRATGKSVSTDLYHIRKTHPQYLPVNRREGRSEH